MPTEPDWMLPKVEDQPKDEAGQKAMVDRWIRGMKRQAEEVNQAAIEAFANRGWPFRWFVEWQPKTDQEKVQAEALDEAIEVAQRYYPPILERGLDRAADMGILQSKGWGGSEGIQAKRPPYASNELLISVYALTGPSNFDAVEKKVHFEPGARSHVFHLMYRELPTLDRLQGDLAAYPLITAESNRSSDSRPWLSEGWTSRRKLYEHKPWDTIAPLWKPAEIIPMPEIQDQPKRQRMRA